MFDDRNDLNEIFVTERFYLVRSAGSFGPIRCGVRT